MKKALSIVLALMMVLSTVSLAAPTMVSTVTDANETSVDATEIEKTTLASTTSEAATFKPGVNILTGTEEAFNFDNDAYTLVGTGNRNVYLDGKRIFVLSDGTASITESPVAGESTNKALKMGGFSVEAGKTSYPQVINFAGSLPEDSRPVFVGIKTLVANGDNVASGSSGSGLRVGANNSTTAPYANGNYTYVNLYTSTQTPTAWLNYGTMDKVSTTALPRFVYNIKAVESAATVDIYMDDIYMTPYYKVTYMNGDQQIGEPVWVLDDGNGNILDSFDPSEFDDAITMPEGKNAWSLTNGGKATHDVELNNEDIVVYAVNVEKVPEAADELIYSFEFNNDNDVSYWTVSNGTNLDVKDGKVVLDSNVQRPDGKSFDAQLKLDNRKSPGIVAKDIKKIAVRIKVEQLDEYTSQADTGENAGKVYTYDWSAKSFSDTLKSNSFTFYIATATGGTKNFQYSYKNAPVDDNGFYNVEIDVSETTGAMPDGELLSMFRIDGTACLSKWTIDYVRVYGDKNNFVPSVEAPVKVEGESLRVADPSTTGVRFRAAIANSLRSEDKLTEYGWIVALADTLGDNELTHEFKSANGKKSYVVGKAFCKAENIDKIYEIDAENDRTLFTAVLTGVPTEQASKYLVVRPYSIVYGAYVYGESRITSPKAVGQKIYDDWVEDGKPESHDYVKYQEFIDSLGITK